MLYFVPTPIGNRGDMTQRAIEVLGSVDHIACEDTRHSRPLLQHFGIQKPLIALHDFNEGQKAKELIVLLEQGEKIAVISDAGMPGISDPGYRLMQAAIAAKVEYTVLPGPSAVLTALLGSGFPVHAFTYQGFLPVKKGKRLQVLAEATSRDLTSIFFESPHRILSTLEILAKEFPAHPVCVARELSKKFETYHKGSASELFGYFNQHKPKGEIVFLVAPLGYQFPFSC
jgi:16S rRNA (cytidine1402-2'-O)-methyltransferase